MNKHNHDSGNDNNNNTSKTTIIILMITTITITTIKMLMIMTITITITITITTRTMIMITIRIKIETLGKNCGFKPISFFEKNPGHGAVGHLSPSCSEAALRRSFRGAWRWRPNGAWRGVTSKGLSDV